MRILLPLIFQFILLTGLFSQNYYTVKFPDDKTIHGCGVSADTVWPVITQYGNCNFNVGVSITDQVFYLNATHTCKKILRTWKLLYWCDYNPNWPAPYYIQNPTSTDVGPTVTANSDNHGYLSYTQIIKVIDNAAPVVLNCPNDGLVFCDYTTNDPTQYHVGPVDRCEGPVNLNIKVTDACSKTDLVVTYLLYLDLDSNGSMETFISSSDATAYPIDLTTDHDTLTAKIHFPTGFGLPYGTHKVEWKISDNCGNQTICKYSFIVKDCSPPTVVCMNGLSVNIMQTGMITLWDTDFLQYTYDNCTAANLIKTGIRKVGAGSGFPTDSHSVTFNCSELGKQFVELWAIDAYGNADYCKTYVIVQDNMGSCPSVKSLKGTVATDLAKGLPGVTLKLKKSTTTGLPMVWTATTNATGQFDLGGPFDPANYILTPVLDTLPKAGVNTLDALLTAAHLSNILPLATPYRIVAADVNRDGQVNASDVKEMVQVITGQTPKFQQNASWRFIPADFAFPNPAVPLATVFPETALVSSAIPDVTQNFVAVKTGDVDGSANLSLFSNAEDRKPQKQVRFSAQDISFEAGETVRVDLLTPIMTDMAGFQFTLSYNTARLALNAIEPGIVPLNQIGQIPGQGSVTTSWFDANVLDGTSWGDQRLLAYTLEFKALQAGLLRQSLGMNSTVTGSEAYNVHLETMGAALSFESVTPRSQGRAALRPIQPNPAIDQINATYYIPQDGPATFRLMNTSGRVVWSNTTEQAQGNHQLVIPLDGLDASGLMLLQLECQGGTAIQKVVVER
jgi:hypothetical protein